MDGVCVSVCEVRAERDARADKFGGAVILPPIIYLSARRFSNPIKNARARSLASRRDDDVILAFTSQANVTLRPSHQCSRSPGGTARADKCSGPRAASQKLLRDVSCERATRPLFIGRLTVTFLPLLTSAIKRALAWVRPSSVQCEPTSFPPFFFFLFCWCEGAGGVEE